MEITMRAKRFGIFQFDRKGRFAFFANFGSFKN